MPAVEVFADRIALIAAAAEVVVQAAADACRTRGRFVFCLSGGQTPRALYELLATDAFAKRIDWAHTELCFGDERCVPPDDPASNYRMASQALIAHVPIAAAHVHRIAAELSPTQAADDYEARLRALLGVSSTGQPAQAFDLVLLGLGADGHTASLFPDSVDEEGRWVSARAAQPVSRITLTPLALNAAECVCFLVAGADKAERLAQLLAQPRDPRRLPAQRITPSGRLRFLVDRAAASALTEREA